MIKYRIGNFMPIKIPQDLPARAKLEDENIFVMTEDRAVCQDIRPLEIAIVNLMPTKIATETQLLRLLGNSPLQVNITLLHTAAHRSTHVSPEHLSRFYKTFAEIKDKNLDGIIITGAPVEHLPFDQVDYWDELVEIMEYARKRVYSTLYLCWAAQAALNYFYNVPKYILDRKLSGVFCHEALRPESPLFRGFDDLFFVPHSRRTEIRGSDILNCPDLRILAESAEAGPAILEKTDLSQVFITGHLEYDRETLNLEYQRDLAKGLNPHIPLHYYPEDDPKREPVMNWKSHAHLFFSNWLNYYVYQGTPFDLAFDSGKWRP